MATDQLRQMRIALAQINPTVGDLRGNSELIVSNVAQAVAAGAHLVVFPEMCLTGYPVEDLALRPSFRAASKSAIAQLATRLQENGYGEIVAVVGYLDQIDHAIDRLGQPSGAPQNAIAIISLEIDRRTADGHGYFKSYFYC